MLIESKYKQAKYNVSIKAAMLLVVVSLFGLSACKNVKPDVIGLQDGKLAQCPGKPNCVLSQDADEDHAIEAIAYSGSVDQAKDALRSAVAAYDSENAEWQADEGNYMYVTFTTSLMRYVDDVEFLIEDGVVHVRSASRVGHSDLGANRKRVEAIRVSIAK